MQNLSFVTRGLTVGLLLGLAGFSGSAAGQDDQNLNDARNKPPCATPASVTLDYVEYEVLDLVKYMAETSCRNLILGGDDLKGKVTIISHKPVPYWTAFSAMESALATAGYTMVEVGGRVQGAPDIQGIPGACRGLRGQFHTRDRPGRDSDLPDGEHLRLGHQFYRQGTGGPPRLRLSPTFPPIR